MSPEEIAAARAWAGRLRFIDLDREKSPIADTLDRLCDEVEALKSLLRWNEHVEEVTNHEPAE